MSTTGRPGDPSEPAKKTLEHAWTQEPVATLRGSPLDALATQIEAYKELKALELLAPFAFALSICLLSIVAGLTTPHESELVVWGASYGPRTAHEYWRLLTALFLNTNPYLLCLNATATFILGRALCLAMGPVVFCGTFLVSGACSVIIATTSAPQEVIYGSSFALSGLGGAIFCCLFFKWLRHKIPFESFLFLILYASVLAYSMSQGKTEISPEIAGISFAVGILCTLFWNWETKHWVFSLSALAAIACAFRVGLTSLPTEMDRFALDSAIQKLKLLTSRELRTLDEKYRHGELSDIEFINQLNIRILQPSRYVLAEITSIQTSEAKVAAGVKEDPRLPVEPQAGPQSGWLKKNRAELEYRRISLESMLAVLAARASILEADDLMKRGDQGASARLDHFWNEQLTTLHERRTKITSLQTSFPDIASELESLRVGLDSDSKILLESATNLEVRRTESWLNHLRDQVIAHTESLPALSRIPTSVDDGAAERVSVELRKQISDHAERLSMISEKRISEKSSSELTPTGHDKTEEAVDEKRPEHPDSQRERLEKLEAYVMQMKESASDPLY